MEEIIKPNPLKGSPEYKEWLSNLKSKIRSTQIKTALAVNAGLIGFYWELGKMISEKQTVWGSKFIEQLSKDLKAEFPGMEGFSRRNLFNTVQFYSFYSKVQQPVGQMTHRARPPRTLACGDGCDSTVS